MKLTKIDLIDTLSRITDSDKEATKIFECMPIGAIQRILGHENRTTTEIYLHSIGGSEREAMKIFDNEIEVNPQTNPQTEIKKDLPVSR